MRGFLGIVHNYPALEYPFEKVRQLIDVNVHGVYLTAREAARQMTNNGKGGPGGSIILIASMSGTVSRTCFSRCCTTQS